MNRYQLLDLDQPSTVDLELGADVCSCGHETEDRLSSKQSKVDPGRGNGNL